MDERQYAGVGGTTTYRTSDVFEQAKQTVSESAGELGGVLQQQVDKGYHRAGEMLDEWVSSFDKAAETLEQQGNHEASEFIHSATHQAQRVTDYIEHTSVDDVLSDASDYASKHMWTVVAAGAALGLLVSRFVKASSMAGSSESNGGYPRRFSRYSSDYRSGYSTR
jgi:ElaB/YqjD/DUF883 family membrane-anchored ribosome-binding protein